MERLMTPVNRGGFATLRLTPVLAALALVCCVSHSARAASCLTLSGAGPSSINDKQTKTPFTGIFMSESCGSTNVTITVTVDSLSKGSFTGLSGFTDNNDGSYTFTGTPAAAQLNLRGMVFTPVPNRITPGTTEIDNVTIVATNGTDTLTNTATAITVLSIDDAPTLTGVVTSLNITDKQSTNLFAGFVIQDVDLLGNQGVTVTILQDDSQKGTILLNGSGFGGGPTNITFHGTPSAATTAIGQLSYRPTENRKPVGTNEITTFTVMVQDDSGTNSANSPLTTTVSSLSINDPPTIANVSSTPLFLATGGSATPFSSTVFGDVDVGDYTNQVGQHVMLQVTYTGTNGNGTWIDGSGRGNVSGSIFTLPLSTLSDANYAIQHLTYRAQSFALTGTNTLNFALTVTDDHGGSTTNSSASVKVYTPYTPPGLTGTRANQRLNDNSTIALFNTVSLQSFNSGTFTVVLSLDNDIKGQLVNLVGFVKNTNTFPARYMFSGDSETATADIRQLLFRPTPNRINGGSTDTTTFSITLIDGGVTNAPDNSTTVIVSPVNDAPTIQGISPLATMNDTDILHPFPTILVTDVDELGAQNQTVTIRLDDSAKGSFQTNSLGLFATNSNGGYVGTGSPSAVTAALRGLFFVPTSSRLAAGASENVTFSVSVDDGQGGVATDNNTVVKVSAVNGGPGFSLPGPQPLSLPLASNINPFASVIVTDPQLITLTVRTTNSNWGSFTSNSLAAFGFTNTAPGTYQVSDVASNVTADLQGLAFAPNTNLVLGTVIVFSLNAVDQLGNANSATLAITLRLNQKSLIVTKTTDYDPNDNSVTPAQKGGTLRKAVQDAGSSDHITFDIRSPLAGSADYPAVITLKTNLVLNKNVVFDGPGADLLSISGDTDGNGTADQQIFEVNAQVAIYGLTMTKGHHPFSGGAIEVNAGGSLTMSYCAVTESRADVWGGGIDVNGGSLNVDHCLFQNNRTSLSFGEGGGAVSLYTEQDCSFVNTTFAGNQQMASSGLGGGALYAENFDPGVEFDVLLLGCTFSQNVDAAGHGSSVRPNVFNTEVWLQDTIVADGSGKNLEMDMSGDVISLGGNLSDDATHSIFSMGGYPYDTTIFTHPPDFTNTTPNLLPLTNNLGPTYTFALAGNSAAINGSVSNAPGATFYGLIATDQRGYWRTDGEADIGAYELTATQHIVMQEIQFANTNRQFIEFYVPRDSAPLNLGGFSVQVHGQVVHVFSPQNLGPGEALVLWAHSAVNVVVPTGVYSQTTTNGLLMNVNADTIRLLNTSNQVVLEVSYIGSFTSSDPNDPGYLTAPLQSIVLSPAFHGCYLPYQRVVAHYGQPPGTNDVDNPGYDPTGTKLAAGNAPPIAYNDYFSTDAQTPMAGLPVLANDRDPDVADQIRVVGVGITNGVTPGVFALTSLTHFGAAVTNNTNGLSIYYDPTSSAFLRSLPQGSNVVDWFQYTILDSSNGLDHLRGSPTNLAEISNNIVKATATVSVTVTGVNFAPTPQDDGTNTNPRLTTREDTLLDFTTADTILWNDTDPNSDDNATTLTIISVEPTRSYQNSLQCVSALGAFVTLDIRFDRSQTHIIYDPRGSAVLNSLAVGQTADDVFYYSVMDRHGAIGTAAVHITVTGINDIPQANADFLATDEDTPLVVPFATLLGNDIDPDTGITNPVSPALTVSAVTPASARGASVQIVGQTVIYDPTVSSNLNALARKEIVLDTFTYTATDAYGASSNALVTVTVTGRNDRPIPAPDFYSTGEKILLSVAPNGVLGNDRDPDVNGITPDDTLRVIPGVKTSAMGATASMNADGSFTYDPRGVFDWLIQDQLTNDTFTYVVMDHSLTIANNDVYTVRGSSSSNVLQVLANDALLSGVGGSLTIVGVSAPDQSGAVVIDPTAHSLIYTPAANFFGVETFFYTNADGLGGFDFASVTVAVTVDPLNGNLVANADSFTVARGTSVNLDVLANDNTLPGLGSTLTIVSVNSTNQGSSVSILGGGPNNLISYTPNPSNTFPAIENFTYVISGGGAARATGTVAVTVIDRANAITANDDTFTVAASSANYPLDVLANDMVLPGATANLIITDVQTNNVGLTGTVSVNSNRTGLLYRPPANATNHDEPFFTYTVSDGAGGTGTGTVLIQVRASGFFANDDVFTVTKNSQNNTLGVLQNDLLLPISGATITITDIGLGSNAPNQGGIVAINPSSTTLSYSPPPNFVGDETFTYEIAHGTVDRAQAHVRIHVIDTATLNSNPDTYSVAKDSANNSLPVIKNDYVLPKTLLAFTITGLETNGIRGAVSILGSLPNNVLSYTPPAGFIGREIFAYETADGRGNKGTNQVVVNVGNLITRDDRFSVLSGSASNALLVLANDAFLPDTTTVRPISGLGATDHGGTVMTNAGGTNVIYTPAPGFVGTEHFTYQVQNDTGGQVSGNVSVEVVQAGSDRATNLVTVTIIGTNDPPTITGVQGGFNITDKQSVAPFTNVTIADVDARGLQVLTVTVSLDLAAKGTITNLGGFAAVSGSPGYYRMTGIGSNITAAIRGLVFVPTENRITVPTTETTTLSIAAYDGYITVTNSGTTINVTAVNDPPIISGTLGNQRVYDHLPIAPFSGVTITEVDDLTLQPLNITVTLAQPTFGYLTSLGGFVLQSNGVYTLTHVTAAQATAALEGILYVPTPGSRLGLGGTETNRLTIAVNDGFAPPVVDSNTTIISTDSFVKKLLASGGTKQDLFGYAVSSERDLVLVGMPMDTFNGIKSGTAYLYSRNLGGPDAFGQLKKFNAGDSQASDLFGYSVSLSGDTAVVGAPNGNTNGVKTGAVYIFDRNQGGPNNWGQSKKIASPDGAAGDHFGGAVSLSGDTLLVGAYLNKPGNARSGSLYIYGRNQGGPGAWGLIKKLAPPDGADGDEYAYAVALNGDTAAIGGPLNIGPGNRNGAVYVYDRNQGGANNWGQTTKIIATNAAASAGLGQAVGISGDLILAGAPNDVVNGVKTGSGYVFSRNQGGANRWGLVNRLAPSDGEAGDQFGSSVTIDGELMGVGSILDIDHGVQSGAVYLFVRNYPGMAQWTQFDKLVPPIADHDDNAGFAISLSQNTLAIGAHFDDSSNNKFGVTFVYRLKFDNAPYVARPIPDQIATPFVPFTFTLPSGTFADPDVNETLTYSMSFFPPPPAWLNFSPSTATFSGLPDNTPGTYPVIVRATDSDGASVTASFNIIIPGPTGPIAPTAKQNWRTTYFSPDVLSNPALEATVWGDNADADGDGVTNLREYLFGTNPLSPDPGDATEVQIAPSGNPGTVLVTWNRRIDDWHLSYSLQTSSDFVTWQTVDPVLIVNETTSPFGVGVQQVTQEVQMGTDATVPQVFSVKVIFLVPDSQ
jgi:VCBS repeat-containing protein